MSVCRTAYSATYDVLAPKSFIDRSIQDLYNALVPPERFLGAARNIENGGSLTIFATALVETGSVSDTLIFEEYKGTSNAELRLDRKIAGKRVYPAVDVSQSSTRKEELLLSDGEFTATRALRLSTALYGRDSQQSIDMLLDSLRKTHTNTEFLTQLIRTTLAPAIRQMSTPLARRRSTRALSTRWTPGCVDATKQYPIEPRLLNELV